MKVIDIFTRGLFMLCLLALLLTAGIAWAANSLWLYEYGFEKYDISQNTGLAQPELHQAASGLISYFNSDEENISLTVLKDGESFELFNEREIVHLQDVKGLFQLNYRVLLGALVYALGYAGALIFWRKDRRRLGSGMIGGGVITLALILLLGLGAMVSFDRLFLQFHLISFTNEFWILDPTSDYLIMLFPRGFWFDAVIACALAAVGGAVMLGGVGFYLRFRGRAVSV